MRNVEKLDSCVASEGLENRMFETPMKIMAMKITSLRGNIEPAVAAITTPGMPPVMTPSASCAVGGIPEPEVLCIAGRTCGKA
mmetsp:Transcript_75023/g.160696  ORF Transcript_75023/g.160696 Transcript_75023/m.160696 type:complete len:83 (+) Transcript_75023:355-603(+)